MIAFVLVALTAAAAPLCAQPALTDPRVASIGLLRARSELIQAESAYARIRHLHERHLVSSVELEASAAERERATLGLIEQWLAASSATPGVRVVRAFKGRDVHGRIVARVRLWMAGATERTAIGLSLPDEIRARVRESLAGDLFVSVKDESGADGTAIGVPYEHRIAGAEHATEAVVVFRLLRDVDAVVVAVTSNGRAEERKVWLETDVGGAIAIHPVPFAQEADLGTDAIYELTLERFGGNDVPIRLALNGLPPAMAHAFTDAETGARIGQLRFAAGEHARRLRLTLSLPDASAGAFTVDSAYRFTVIASAGGDPPAMTIAGVAAGARGVAELELVPRGVGRAELRIFNLFHEVDEGTSLTLPVAVRNSGTRAIDHLRVQADVPAGWTVVSAPAELRDIAPGSEEPLRLTIAPAGGVGIGDYELRLSLDGAAGRTRLSTAPAVVRTRIRARRGWIATATIVAALLFAAGGGVVLTRRLGHR